MLPPILILHATGTNRDREAAWACELAGGAPEIVHMNQLLAGERRLMDYRMLVLPGGFSYGDDLGAGKLWAVALRHGLGDGLEAFVAAGRPVLGICNGFQALVKAGLLPALRDMEPLSNLSISPSTNQQATLTRNDSGRFECRWVYLQPQAGSPCVFTQGLHEPIYCPVAHGEGKFVARDKATLAAIEAQGLVALRYAREPHAAEAAAAEGVEYPWNPNGSQNDIAGVCNPAGNVFGLMPHPEDHIVPHQHPRAHRGEHGCLGLPLFVNGVRYAAEVG
ncbi:MAG: phosphoribosylformylglycinamidine synthase I [Caldilineales bacterium]|nr:phosphoribosylformylglycinamidine synthase I [Caldilineales bacterium]MDW8316389.1 phosphoribosylformylglycinamidine synthase I [Anaerolineae bacterium]